MVGIKNEGQPPSILIISNNKYDKSPLYKKGLVGNSKYLKGEDSILKKYDPAYHYDGTIFTEIVTFTGQASDIPRTNEQELTEPKKIYIRIRFSKLSCRIGVITRRR